MVHYWGDLDTHGSAILDRLRAWLPQTRSFLMDRETLLDHRERRPLVDTIHGSSMANLKELRPGTVRILFAFDPWRSTILLVAGDKAGKWNAWYQTAIPLAEQRYERYLTECTQEEEER